MSMVGLANMCSHLQNASKARLGLTSIALTKQNLAVALCLQREGFISAVTRGSHRGPDEVYTPTTNENVSTRRLWLTLKYYDNEPVMTKLIPISKPTRRIWMGFRDLKSIGEGTHTNYIRGLNPGEALILSTDRGYMELREAVKILSGGQLLCRVS